MLTPRCGNPVIDKSRLGHILVGRILGYYYYYYSELPIYLKQSLMGGSTHIQVHGANTPNVLPNYICTLRSIPTQDKWQVGAQPAEEREQIVQGQETQGKGCHKRPTRQDQKRCQVGQDKGRKYTPKK